jgi:hypothetical protein
MDNYEGALDTGLPRKAEASLTKAVADYIASLPSSAYLAGAVGAMALSLALRLAGRGKWGRFIGQCALAPLIVGLYNQRVKHRGHERADGARNRGYDS